MPTSPRLGRSPRDYTWVHRALEPPLTLILGDGWSARLAYRLGLQGPPQVARYDVTLAARDELNNLHPDTGRPGDPVGRGPSDNAYPARMLRIGFASDFHAGPSTDPRVLAAACDELIAEAPDIILLGGDYVAMHVTDFDIVLPQLRRLTAPLGVYSVLGNHDLWADEVPITAALEAAGIRVLKNENVRLASPWDDVWLCGLDEPTSAEPDATTALADADGYRVVLMHSPIGLEALGGADFDLAVCGHTHGGQIGLPGGRPILLPPGRLNRRYHAGRFDLPPAKTPGGSARPRTLMVSRGVGCGAVPLRLFAPADVMVVTVRC